MPAIEHSIHNYHPIDQKCASRNSTHCINHWCKGNTFDRQHFNMGARLSFERTDKARQEKGFGILPSSNWPTVKVNSPTSALSALFNATRLQDRRWVSYLVIVQLPDTCFTSTRDPRTETSMGRRADARGAPDRASCHVLQEDKRWEIWDLLATTSTFQQAQPTT